MHEPKHEEEDKAEHGEPLHGKLQQSHCRWEGFCLPVPGSRWFRFESTRPTDLGGTNGRCTLGRKRRAGLCWNGSRPPVGCQGKLVSVRCSSLIDVRRAATVWWCQMFQLTAQDSWGCRSPDPAAKSADEAGGAVGEALSLGSN